MSVAAQTNAPTPTSTPTPIQSGWLYPGQSNIPSEWPWDEQGVASVELVQNMGSETNPIDIALLMQRKFTWKDTYDTSHFLSPNELTQQKYGVCSAFARYWKYVLEAQGVSATMLSFWGPNSAHAVTIFISPIDHKWHMGSNQYYHSDIDLAPGISDESGLEEAKVNAAKFWYGDNWTEILTFDEGGVIIGKIKNPNLQNSSPTPSLQETVFSIRD